MKFTFLKSLVLVLCVLPFGSATAGAPTCSSNNGNPYCQYDGKISRAYVNSNDLMLLYFDTPLDLSLLTAVGLTGISQSTAAAVRVSANENFAKLFYSTMLTAQARDTTITVLMRGNFGGYLIIDRIWINP